MSWKTPNGSLKHGDPGKRHDRLYRIAPRLALAPFVKVSLALVPGLVTQGHVRRSDRVGQRY